MVVLLSDQDPWSILIDAHKSPHGHKNESSYMIDYKDVTYVTNSVLCPD
jgi:hypothetical protein